MRKILGGQIVPKNVDGFSTWSSKGGLSGKVRTQPTRTLGSLSEVVESAHLRRLMS